jgi:hypothetical protein
LKTENHELESIMHVNLRRVLYLVAAVLIVLAFQSPARPQGSGSSRSSPPRATRPPTPEEFYTTFWQHIVRQDAPFTKWRSLTGKEGPVVDSPHGAFVRIYANKAASDSPNALPMGAVIVADNYDKDKKRTDITVMYRVKGTDPKHNDWYWFKYLPDGSIARTSEKEGKKAIAGKVTMCIDCHSRAGGSDFVFSNDEEKPNEKSPDKKIPDEK